jgi:N-acetylneuraminic acid mutarotase
VTVATQPIGELCTVTGGTGTIPAAAVTSVAVACSGWVWENGADLSSSPSTAPVVGVYGTQGTPAAGNVPGARDSQITWTDSAGKFWMFGGTGVDGSGTSGQLNDLWMYDPAIQQWTSENASHTANVAGVYGTQGTPAAGNLPGARHSGMIWLDGSGHVWLFGGVGYDENGLNLYLADLWMYNPSTQLWTFEGGSKDGATTAPGGSYGSEGVPDSGNLPGARAAASTWIDSSGKLWMFGGEFVDSVTSSLSYFNDVWVYDPGTQQWTWMSGTNLLDQNGVAGGTPGSPIPGSTSVNNVPGGRFAAASWQDTNGNFWLFGGGGYDLAGTVNPDVLSDLWMFNPTNLTWTWEGGSSVVDITGNYGTQGTAAAGNLPGARGGSTVWTDSAGQVWLFGGNGYGGTTTTKGLLNDLWNYNPTTQQWTWVSGGQTTNDVHSASYGTIGTPAAGNQPGDRAGASGWVDSTGNLWMFGGFGFDAATPVANFGDMNDLWMF